MAYSKLDFTKAKNAIIKTEAAKMLIACEVVEAEAKDLCPVAEGELIGSFEHEVVREANEIIGRIKNTAGHAAHVEFGTKPHVIEPRDKKNLTFKVDGQWISTKKVNHPGFAGIPFLRGALISKKREVKDILDLQ